MADGTSKPIEYVVVGDRVLTRDQYGDEASDNQAGTVTRTFIHHHDGTLVLAFADGSSVHTTDEHPFYLHGRGFTPAGQLTVGDEVAEAGRELDRIVSIVRIPGAATVYNFEVAGGHTYFVKAGRAPLWVHNSCERPGKIPEDWLEKPARTGGGTRWVDPNNPHTNVRIDPAKNGFPRHVHVWDRGTPLGPNGEGLSHTEYDDPLRHIPIEIWEKWKHWNRPF